LDKSDFYWHEKVTILKWKEIFENFFHVKNLKVSFRRMNGHFSSDWRCSEP